MLLLSSKTQAPSFGPRVGVSGLALAAIAALATAALLPGEASARKNSYSSWGNFFGYDDDAPRYYARPKPRVIKRKTPKADETDEAAAPKVSPYKGDGSPMFLLVSLKRQRIVVYDSNGRVAEAPISSGRIGFATPTGVFTVLEKNKVHFSNLYESAPMPNMQRITWSGVALHAGDLPGYPASHGCIRLPRNFSQQLFGMTKLGTRVVVSRDALEPLPIAHAKLFSATPPERVPGASPPQALTATLQTVSAETTNPAAMTQSLDISAADASEMPAASASLSPYRAKQLAEKAAAETALASARDDKAKRETEAKAAVSEADAAKLGIRAANVEVAKLQAAVDKAEKLRDDGDRQLADYAGKYTASYVATLTEDERVAAAQDEQDLEAKALQLSDAVEAAKAAVVAAKGAVTAAEAKAAEIDAKRREAIHALADAGIALKKAGVALSHIRAAEALRNYPVSVFVSRKNGRLYVRQNQRPMFDVPVTFEQPEQPLGTHVFTALDYANETKTEVRWNVISIATASASAKPDTRSRYEKLKAKVQHVPEPVPAVRQSPQVALDRLSIDAATRERIVDVMKPGSSVIISDHGLGNETGQYTDFIVQTNN